MAHLEFAEVLLLSGYICCQNQRLQLPLNAIPETNTRQTSALSPQQSDLSLFTSSKQYRICRHRRRKQDTAIEIGFDNRLHGCTRKNSLAGSSVFALLTGPWVAYYCLPAVPDAPLVWWCPVPVHVNTVMMMMRFAGPNPWVYMRTLSYFLPGKCMFLYKLHGNVLVWCISWL